VVDKADSQLGVRWILAVGRHQYDQVAGNLASAFEDLHHTHRHWLAAVPVLKMINRLRIHRISTAVHTCGSGIKYSGQRSQHPRDVNKTVLLHC